MPGQIATARLNINFIIYLTDYVRFYFLYIYCLQRVDSFDLNIFSLAKPRLNVHTSIAPNRKNDGLDRSFEKKCMSFFRVSGEAAVSRSR